MTVIVLAILVGALFATGTSLVMARGQVRLILGLALLSHGVNLLLFGSGVLTRGAAPIFADKENYALELAERTFADPLPQALILTAIVISFGITAFLVVLVSRRDAFTGADVVPGELARYVSAADPFHTPVAGADGAGASPEQMVADLRTDYLSEAS
ncbi:MAG: sodium:proton antiporter, partial [Caldilineaceae bacterium]